MHNHTGGVYRASVVYSNAITGQITVVVPQYAGVGATFDITKIGRSAIGGIWDVPNSGDQVLVAADDENFSNVFLIRGTTKTYVDHAILTSTVPSAGFRNAIINGGFDIWQRGAGGLTVAAGVAILGDMWVTGGNGTSSVVSRQSWSLGAASAAFPYEPTYYYRQVVTSSASVNNYALIEQRIEGVRTFAGQTVTLSFWMKADAAKNVAVEFHQYFGTGGSPSAEVTAAGGVTTVALTTTMTRYSVTVTLPSISGKTLGTNGDDSLRVTIWLDAGSTYNARTNSLGQQSGTYDLWGVQLEAGSVATPFERRPVGAELALCQRYYYAPFYNNAGPNYAGLSIGSAYATSNTFHYVPLPVPMRIPPSYVANGMAGTDWRVTDGTNAFQCSAISLYAPSTHCTMVDLTTTTVTAGVLTQFRPYELQRINNTLQPGFSAEL